MEGQQANDSIAEQSPKISIIVPVLNVAPYLQECLNSILSQTLLNIEVICGDGGSTDGSFEILQSYAAKDKRIHLLRKLESGYGMSVNDCMRISKGKYIGIVEPDDVIKPDMYETLFRVAEEKALDWVRGDIYFYYTSKKGKPLLRYEKIIIGNFYDVVLNPQVDLRPYRSRLRTWSGIYRRSFLEKYSIYHNETPGAAFQDVGFYLKTLYYAQRVAFVHHPLYMWRQDNQNSSSHYGARKLIERSTFEWSMEEKFLEQHPEIGELGEKGFLYRRLLAYMWMVESTIGDEKNLAKELAMQVINEAIKSEKVDYSFFTGSERKQLKRFIRTGETTSLIKTIKKRIKAILMLLICGRT